MSKGTFKELEVQGDFLANARSITEIRISNVKLESFGNANALPSALQRL